MKKDQLRGLHPLANLCHVFFFNLFFSPSQKYAKVTQPLSLLFSKKNHIKAKQIIYIYINIYIYIFKYHHLQERSKVTSPLRAEQNVGQNKYVGVTSFFYTSPFPSSKYMQKIYTTI